MKTQSWIKTALKAQGLKLKDAAERLGLPAPRITDILKGMREVQADEVIPLAEMLGMTATQLLRSLEAGKPLAHEQGEQAGLDILGQLTGTGTLLPVPQDWPFHRVAVPPDAQTAKGLYCYIMGDDSLAREIHKDSLVIAADPRQHYYPLTPGAILLMRLGADRLVLRKFHRTATGEDWLIPLPAEPSPEYQSWRLALSKNRGRENGPEPTLGSDDIVAAVLWVHRQHKSVPAAD